MSGTTVEDFPERVKRLARERGFSVSRVGYSAFDPERKGTNPDTFRSVMARRRRVTRVLIEAVAEALGQPPDEFPEYRLALIREQFDENAIGLEAALENLKLWDAATARASSSEETRLDSLPEGGPSQQSASDAGALRRIGRDR